MESGPIAEYDRALVPGLSIVTLRVVPWLLEPNEAPAKLWLRKRGAPVTALDVAAPNSEQTYAFTMPVALLRHAAEATRHAARNPAHPGPSGHFPEPQYSLPPR